MRVGTAQHLPDDRVSKIEELAPAERLRRLVDAHFDFIWRALRRLGVREGDVDDGAQEVFAVASRRLSDIPLENERAFLFGTAFRVASTYRRRAMHRYEQLDGAVGEHPARGPDPEQQAARLEARVLLDRLLDVLSLEQRAVFVLYELEELSVPDIAELLGVPVGTAASRLRRARAAFSAASEHWRQTGQIPGRQP